MRNPNLALDGRSPCAKGLAGAQGGVGLKHRSGHWYIAVYATEKGKDVPPPNDVVYGPGRPHYLVTGLYSVD